MPPTIPINHYPGSRNQLKIGGQGPIPLSHADVFGGRMKMSACFEHSNFFKVNDLGPQGTAAVDGFLTANSDGDPLRL